MVEYSINMQRLRGEIGSKKFDIAAVSGGGRGSTKGRFLIHGRGPSGSDGCIVPLEQFNELMDAIAAAAPVLLRVTDPGAPWHDSFERKPQTRSASA